MDDDQSGTLTQNEFFKACKDFKVGISEENVPALFKVFDRNQDGTMDYGEFLLTIRGEMSETRSKLVKQVFQTLTERNGGQPFGLDFLKKQYEAKRHPDVIQGKRTLDNVIVEFIETFEAHFNLGGNMTHVIFEQFEDYFKSISALYENDEEFVVLMQNTFRLKKNEVRTKNPEAEAEFKKAQILFNDAD